MTDVDTYSFPQMRKEVDALRGAVDGIIAKDKDEAESFFTDLKRLFKHGFGYGQAKDEFTGRADALVADALEALGKVETLCDGALKDNAPIPRQLDVDASDWRDDAQAVREKRAALLGQCKIEGWDDDAKRAYDAAVEVQRSALKELAGVMDSTAQSCEAGARLNRAIFYAVGLATTNATMAIVEPDRPAGGGMYYLRTATAVPVLRALVQQVERAVSGEVAHGCANALTDEMRHTVRMPKLLLERGWPTGTAAVDVEPAPTERGVRSDGHDANTDVEAVINSCLAGANL